MPSGVDPVAEESRYRASDSGPGPARDHPGDVSSEKDIPRENAVALFHECDIFFVMPFDGVSVC